MSRRSQGALIGVLWLVFIAVAVVLVLMVPARLSEHGFPHMPRYGAMTWWFFFAIPLIGLTWGFFNDWKGDRKYRDVR
jgi:hypothetical protein